MPPHSRYIQPRSPHFPKIHQLKGNLVAPAPSELPGPRARSIGGKQKTVEFRARGRARALTREETLGTWIGKVDVWLFGLRSELARE
jgi:hypothetical protein